MNKKRRKEIPSLVLATLRMIYDSLQIRPCVGIQRQYLNENKQEIGTHLLNDLAASEIAAYYFSFLFDS